MGLGNCADHMAVFCLQSLTCRLCARALISVAAIGCNSARICKLLMVLVDPRLLLKCERSLLYHVQLQTGVVDT